MMTASVVSTAEGSVSGCYIEVKNIIGIPEMVLSEALFRGNSPAWLSPQWGGRDELEIR